MICFEFIFQNSYAFYLFILRQMLFSNFLSVIIMARKRRTELPTTSEGPDSQEASSSVGHGAQSQVERAPLQEGGRYQGGRGGGGGPIPQTQHGGRGAAGGRGRYQQRGGMVHQQSSGSSAEYQGRGYQPRGGMPPQQSGPAMLESGGRGRGRGRGGVVGGHGGGGPSHRQLVPELHQASQAPVQAAYPTQRIPFVKESLQASSSFQSPETSDVVKQLQQLSVQSEGQASYPVAPPASSKSMRFPLRPGKGSIGGRCMVKANHFFVELPDKDLHQYDVSMMLLLIFVLVTVRLI